ncbi:MAG: hypothetical protein A2Z75_07720 [Chloroflexi bacterium RBG_13_50_10]|nr:MAG: hypothetical protein A2Z75_07720 [Chloroflexi bacterium RBG_13_50_10]
MSDKDSKKMPKADCCDQKGCCPSPADSTKQQPPSKKQWWKIAVFALGILMIIGATAYSVITRHINASSVPLDKSGIPQIASNTGCNAASTLGIGDLLWAQKLNPIFTDHNLIFVILPGDDSNSNTTLANRISDATAKIEARHTSVGTFTLSASDPEFSITTERLAITQLPAVLALSTTGNGAIITGDITEAKLLQTYVVVSQPICAPGSSSGCCSGK